MFIPEQAGNLMVEKMLFFSRNKEEVISAFLREYGEQATWEDWLAFLRERSEVEEFKWIVSLENEFSVLQQVYSKKK